jgi:hypothetical protein
MHTGPRVQRASGIPCALSFSGAERFHQNSRETRGEIAKVCLSIFKTELKMFMSSRP